MSIAIKLNKYLNGFFKLKLQETDVELYNSIRDESLRQQNHIELIASENIVSKAVLEAQGSILTNKYAEGYPGKRYYGGCEHVDVSENLAIERAKKLFNCNFANVQPHSGAQANGAVYLALIKPGDTILGMSLNSGGHLTHGAKPAQSGKWFNAIHYEVDKTTGLIDYDNVERLALENKPKIIIAGGSAYSRIIDFKKFREISDKIWALLITFFVYILKSLDKASLKQTALAAITCINGPPCKPGKIALLNFFINSSLLVKIIPPLGPRNTLCVVDVTTSAYLVGFGYSPPATKPEKCAISTKR